MKQDSVFHGVELLLNYYLSLFMTKKLFAGGMLALLAGMLLVSCTTDGGDEVQYVKIGQNLCSFRAEGNQPLEIDVKASPAEWTVEAGATWVKAERTDNRTLTVTVEDNDTGSERSAVLTVTAGQAVQEIGIRQLAPDGAFARFRKLDTFAMGARMSPSGRYAGGFVISIAADDSYQYSPTIVDLETDEWHQFGPYPESVYALHQTMAITDQGLLFISDGTNGGQIAIDLTGDIFIPEAPADFQFRPEIQGTSADGNFWVGFGKKEAGGLYYPLLWIDGAAQELSLPEKNYREEELRAGVMARSISANGEVIYGTSWDNSDFGMLYWEKEGAGFGRPQWVGEDVREITPTVMQYQDGTEYDYNLVNGCICQAQLTKISPSGKWIATTYRTETPSANRQYVEYTYAAAFYNTETGTTTIVEDYGETTGVHVTDDGIGFIGIGTLGVSAGKVYDLNTHTDLGDTQDWVYDTYGIVIPGGYINHISADGRYVLGTSAQSSAGGTSFINWYIAPPRAK